ncbi:MAG TPA: hypothetical protein PKM78_10750 [Anaerolineae bacterium]|nr:hypothetical protein [Anaerolineae bacterium]HNU04487.1 hypothetical protein [Anaerolineae bacterium]
MNRNKLMRRLSVVAALVGILVIAAGAPVLQAQPEAGTISTGAAEVWNGHSCPANVPVNIAGLGTGLGGYETKVTWPAGRFDNTAANVGITVSAYLTNGGTRSNSASGTPLLKAVAGDTVKFGDYSWGAGNPPGNMANGQLATVALLPTATCGAAALTMSETQLVDINGNVIGLTAQTGSSVSVFSRYDVNGVQSTINAADASAVVAKIGTVLGGPCDANYRYNVNLVQSTINAADVSAVVAKIGQLTSVACVN